MNTGSYVKYEVFSIIHPILKTLSVQFFCAFIQSTGQPSPRPFGAPNAPVSLCVNLSVKIVINCRFDGVMHHQIILSSKVMDFKVCLALSGVPFLKGGQNIAS